MAENQDNQTPDYLLFQQTNPERIQSESSQSVSQSAFTAKTSTSEPDSYGHGSLGQSHQELI